MAKAIAAAANKRKGFLVFGVITRVPSRLAMIDTVRFSFGGKVHKALTTPLFGPGTVPSRGLVVLAEPSRIGTAVKNICGRHTPP